jgi:CRP-like cAMP-binding protein
MEVFLNQFDDYYPLSQNTKSELLKICNTYHYNKNEIVLSQGDLAYNYYIVKKGLLGYYTLNENGTIIYKIFFEENSFVASTVSIIENKPSDFSIIALEDTELISLPADKFRKLFYECHDLALFQINYLERNWVVEKEKLEIGLKTDLAKHRYEELSKNTSLINRLKQHHIASYLGITPTQLSRIRKELKL